MSEILEFNRSARIREQASIWLVRIQEAMTDEQQLELAEWLASDDAHAEQLLDLATVWDELEVLTELAPLFDGLSVPSSAPPDAERNASSSLQGHALKLIRRIGVAACLLVALGGYWLYGNPELTYESIASLSVNEKQQVNLTEQEISRADHYAPEILRTEIGEHRALTLSDGSVITLNTDTQIEVDFSESQRAIRLHHGEAHFDVVKDPKRPLKVMVSGKSVEALGTAFSVRKKSDTDIEVAVDQGLVAVYQLRSSANQVVEPALKASLDAGDVLVIDDQGVELNEYDIDEMEDRLAWRTGMIVINDETLDYVINEFSRYNEQKILLAERQMGSIRVAGYFFLGDIDALMVALEQNFKIRSEYYQSNNTFVLSQIVRSEREPH